MDSAVSRFRSHLKLKFLVPAINYIASMVLAGRSELELADLFYWGKCILDVAKVPSKPAQWLLCHGVQI